MRFQKLFTAVVLSAGALVATRAAAELVGIAEFTIAGHTQEWTYLNVVCGPELEGMPGTVKFGPAPYVGQVVGVKILHGGPNQIRVPNPHSTGWYTMLAPGCAPKTVEEDDPGLN
jgi:hypothetical protein